MAATTAILMIFYCYLTRSLCCGLLTMVCPSSICLSVTFHILDISIRIVSMMAAMVAILKVFSCYLLPNSKSDGAETLWKASGQHGDLELLKLFRSGIQDGHHGSRLESLQITSAPKGYVWLSLNLMGSIGVLWKFRIAKMFSPNVQDSSHLEILLTTSPPIQ